MPHRKECEEMGVHIIDNNDGEACLYCSVVMVAFGPIMEDYEEAEEFIKFLKEDARKYTEQKLMDQYTQFCKQKEMK